MFVVSNTSQTDPRPVTYVCAYTTDCWFTQRWLEYGSAGGLLLALVTALAPPWRDGWVDWAALWTIMLGLTLVPGLGACRQRWRAAAQRVELAGPRRLRIRHPRRCSEWRWSGPVVVSAQEDEFRIETRTHRARIGWAVPGAWRVWRQLSGCRVGPVPAGVAAAAGVVVAPSWTARNGPLLVAAGLVLVALAGVWLTAVGWCGYQGVTVAVLAGFAVPPRLVRWYRRPRRRRFEVTAEGLLVGENLLGWADLIHLERCGGWRGQGWLVWTESGRTLWVPDTPEGRVVAEAIAELLVARRRPARRGRRCSRPAGRKGIVVHWLPPRPADPDAAEGLRALAADETETPEVRQAAGGG